MNSSKWSEEFVTFTQTLVDSIQIISASAQFFIILSFGYFIFRRNRLSKMKGLFILLSLGYIVDVIQTFGWIMSYLYNYENEFWFNFMEISFKYAIFSISIWNAVVSCNRCSTVLWPLKHSKTKTSSFKLKKLKMNQIENAFASPEEARENHPITEDSKKGIEMLGEIKESLKTAINSDGSSNPTKKQQQNDGSDKLGNADAYANAQFEADYQSAKDKAREEMKEQMCSGNP